MIQRTYLCNLCQCHIHYRPEYGADCLTLYLTGPCGAVGETMKRDECDTHPGHTQYPDPAGGVHICNRCEKGLAAHFSERQAT
jgi:hypothetical protein